jgi:signal transduction histidine kinase
MNGWARPLRATLAATGVVLGTSLAATLVGIALEGPASRFVELESNLVVVTLVALPLLFVALWLRLLERVRHIRLKLFVACLLGQVAALAAVIYAARNKGAMPFDPPSDGLFAVLLVYAATLSLALYSLLAGSITRALTRIRAGAARIAEGDLQTRIAVETRDELAALAADLNALAARLDAAARQERRMEQARRDLIAAVSHDLRTPLAAIRATIEAITDGVVTDEATITRYLRTMHDGTRELSRLIDDLFDLSRLDAGALVLVPEPTALADLVSETLERLRARAEARAVVLNGCAEADLPLLPLDARFIGRVLANLVENAVRHTPAGGQVEVAVYREGPAVRVAVTDTGEGIAPGDLPHIFDRFYRGEKSRSREHGGAGLGLAICKGIVEAHGGRIWAESVNPHGTRVSFTLPIAAPVLTS